jgi:DNA-binding CsgD family transcriptional regulator
VKLTLSLFLLIALNIALYCGVAVWAYQYSRKEKSARLRLFALGLSIVAFAFVLSAFTRLVAVAVRLEWLPPRVGDFMASEWQLMQSLMATALGVVGIIMLRRVAGALRSADRIASAVSERFLEAGGLEELGLTGREMDVLRAIHEGYLSDQELAAMLFISPATAGTHVRNILRKTGVHSRRELALLIATNPET